ncbi:hypothetical protein Jden_1426 [Jonesia denitrificans DSM 20603]|uniref:DUF7455 domain-containing protein n=2 Tax=Jonesia TaxID=43673 RepID=C7R4M1_JONDD|nr:hypothetical protein Jden_1426 [Jonesia denitrificans DSM 20603]SQH21231.1 Uncharacterised protein [Jonesia denitrificans]
MYAGGEPQEKGEDNQRRQWLDDDMSETTTTPRKDTLTAADRCDRCGAQAYVRVVLSAGELLFCAHHARNHLPQLEDVAREIHDETDRLYAEHGSAATAAV